MTIEERIKREHERLREIYIRELESTASAMMEEAKVLRGTNFKPRASYQPSIRPLDAMFSNMHALSQFHPGPEGEK